MACKPIEGHFLGIGNTLSSAPYRQVDWGVCCGVDAEIDMGSQSPLEFCQAVCQQRHHEEHHFS